MTSKPSSRPKLVSLPASKHKKLEQRLIEPAGCVTFQTDVNGRFNFPNQRDFNSFCKQRDLFYQIRQSWIDRGGFDDRNENSTFKHRKGGFSSSNSGRSGGFNSLDAFTTAKIPSIFELNSSPANMSHFASLFLSQYVLDNFNNPFVKKTPSPETKDIKSDQLRQLFETNPSKFNQLQSRLYKPSPNQSKEDFPNFEKLFLKAASSPSFNQHLVDRAVQEITEIETHFSNDTPSDFSEIDKAFKKCKLLAQLAGYIVFLPYSIPSQNKTFTNGEIQHPSSMEKETHNNLQIKLRSYQVCPLQLENMMVTSLKEGRLSFTLSWIIEFLLQADDVTPQLPNYKKIFQNLHRLQQEIMFPAPNMSAGKTSIPTANALENMSDLNQKFVARLCENLFAKSKSFCSDGNINTDHIVNCKRMQRNRFEEDSWCLDADEEVAKCFMKTWFGENWNAGEHHKKSSKSPGNININKNKPLSSTTPISSAETSSPRRISLVSTASPTPKKIVPRTVTYFSKSMKLQAQLETSFFEMHPASVKKTVEFIAERVASNFVKHIRAVLYPQERIRLIQQRMFQEEAARICYKTLWEKLDSGPKDKVDSAVELLIGDSLSVSALDMCKLIGRRKCNEKVKEWLDTHINKDMFPVMPPETAIIKSPKKAEQLPKCCDVRTLQRLVQQLHNSETIEESVVDEIIQNELLAKKCIAKIIELGFVLIAFRPMILTTTRLNMLVQLWKPYWNEEEYKVICSRNIMLVCQSRQENSSWSTFSSLLKCMIENNILTAEQLERECMEFLRQDWPSSVSKRVSNMLKSCLDILGHKADTEVIDWIQWFCSGNEDEQF